MSAISSRKNLSTFSLLALVVLLAAAVFLIPFLSVVPIYQVSEAREGVVVNSMLESGNYLLPLRQAELIPSKPPLFHWLGSVTAKVFGGYREFELRFPSALAAIILVWALFGLARSLQSNRAAILSAFLLLSTYGFSRMSADGRVDMLFCLFLCLSVFRWMLTLVELKSKEIAPSLVVEPAIREIAFYCGLAILTKGPLGLALALAIIVLLTLVEAGPFALRHLLRLQWAWALIISAPWYVFAGLLGGEEFISRQLFFENVHRFTGGEGISPKPPWFYLLEFWTEAAPWSFALLILLFLRKQTVVSETFKPAGAIRMSVVWILTTFVLLSLSSGKRSAYLLPILPPLSLALGCYLDSKWDSLQKFWEEFTSKSKSARLLVAGQLCWLIVVGLFVALWCLGNWGNTSSIESQTGLYRYAAKVIFDDFGQRLTLAFTLISLTSLVYFRRAFAKKSFAAFCKSFFLFIQLILVVVVNFVYGMKGVTHSYRDFAAEVQQHIGNEPLTFVKRKRDESFDGFFFYFRRTVRLYDPGLKQEYDRLKHSADARVSAETFPVGPPEEPGLYLMRQRWFAAVDESWLQRVERIYEGGRLVDKPEEKVVLFRLNPQPTVSPDTAQAPTVTATSPSGAEVPEAEILAPSQEDEAE